jgi:photosystem II stability/assembly factor-like uncharacterized protein
MRLTLTVLCLGLCINGIAQQTKQKENPDNIYKIKEKFLYNVLHNPTEEAENDNDNELARFNRWFNMVEPRAYPSGNLPVPGALVQAMRQQNTLKKAHKGTSGVSPWQPLGPTTVPTNFNGIGRINCIVIDPIDTNTLYVGSACGGVFISQNGGTTWTSHSDQFPSLSIADIAVNPHNTDTIYAATGDGYGYENGAIFWGGLYTAGVMRSTDGGNTWDTTGLSYLQSNKDIIQKLLIHPDRPNELLAATRNGIFRTVNAGNTWTLVETGHVYSMAFRPDLPETVYAVTNTNLRVSYDAGATWSTLFPGISAINNRSSLAVSPDAPSNIWVLDANENLKLSTNAGVSFTTLTSPDIVASFYGYYDRVLAVSPTDANYIVACGMEMAKSINGGASWSKLDPSNYVHSDNHAIAINPLHTATIYSGNDGGISVTYNGGASWKNLGNGLMISQIYKLGNSKQNPDLLLCGLQDNGTFGYNGTVWKEKTGGDGMACAIHPLNDDIQISSYQNGHFFISYDKGASFGGITLDATETGAWVSPVIFNPNNEMVAYFGLKNIYATYDQGGSFVRLTTAPLFSGGAISMAMAPSGKKTIYAADYTRVKRSINGGSTWTDVTGFSTFTGAITNIAVHPKDSMKVFITLSGYSSGNKIYMSTVGGTTWTNISANLPNIPVNCLAIDTSTPGAMFAGTDLGVYYTDSSQTGWTLYSTGLPNVIVNDLTINYTDYKIRAATYGRGVWVCDLKKPKPVVNGIANTTMKAPTIQAYPNPTTASWKLVFANEKPASYSVKVLDMSGRTVYSQANAEMIDASALVSGVYTIEIAEGGNNHSIKAVKK